MVVVVGGGGGGGGELNHLLLKNNYTGRLGLALADWHINLVPEYIRPWTFFMCYLVPSPTETGIPVHVHVYKLLCDLSRLEQK